MYLTPSLTQHFSRVCFFYLSCLCVCYLEHAVHMCDYLGKGKMVDAYSETTINQLLNYYKLHRNRTTPLWIPYTDEEKEGTFGSVYDKLAFPSLPWSPGQPNGGPTQNCVQTSVVQRGRLVDVACSVQNPYICHYNQPASFKLKGLPADSGIDQLYFVQNTDDFLEYIGYRSSRLQFNSSLNKWVLTLDGTKVGESSASKESLLLGKNFEIQYISPQSPFLFI